MVTLIENEAPAARRYLAELHQHTGHAHIIGVTGAPGAGKSYTVDVIQMDTANTTSVILSCSISGTSTTCGASSGTGAASAGTFLQVRITNVGAANSEFMVTFQ